MASPRQIGSLESVGSQRRDHFVNLERRRDRYMAYTHSERVLFIHFERIGQHKASHNTRNEEVCIIWRRRWNSYVDVFVAELE